MLVELRVRNLGVIDDLVVRLGPGMTALTGETGAGKTLVVEALELLLGGRADPSLVRAGAESALVEGRFSLDRRETDAAGELAHANRDGRTGGPGDRGGEIVLAREVPATGRSRAYVDGHMATAATLSEVGLGLVELHGQHAHQTLLSVVTQRDALDRFAGIDTTELDTTRRHLKELDDRLEQLGGDEPARAREVDLIAFQLAELDAASLSDPDEDERLRAEEALLSDLEALRLAAAAAERAIAEEGGARDHVGEAIVVTGRHEPLSDLAGRLEACAAELDDLAAELRGRLEGFEDDPARLAAVEERRHLLKELERKYGPGLEAVISFRDAARSRLADLEAGEARRTELLAAREEVVAELGRHEQRLGDGRRAAAPRLGAEIEARLASLALGRASFRVSVPEAGRGDEVSFLFSANPGEPAQPLSKVASGGELARAMLATRLVLSEAPPTLVFDEVDAGIGGEAALHVGRSLAELGEARQVLVVTHLAQVAAFASCQVAVEKRDLSGRTVTAARAVGGDERLAELSRMLSGQPESEAARRHAEELLAVAGRQ